MPENKFFIKTTLLETISNLEELSTDSYDLVPEILEKLKNVSDKDTLFKMLMNEYFKESVEKRANIMTFLLSNIYDNNSLKEKLWAILKSRHYNDETQNKILNMIKSLGEIVDYNEYIKYFDNPDAVIDKDTENLLGKATFNPESQIDFLDFISTLSDDDWYLMLESLSEDFEGENLANVFIPLVYTNLNNESKLNYLIDMLSKTSSSLAVKAFDDVIKYSASPTCIKKAKMQLNFLKLKGKNLEKADEFYKKSLSNSTFFEAYTGYLDGHGNQCIIVTRKAENDTYQYFCAVVRDLKEIVDCFGFYELSLAEYQKILRRFLQTQRLIKIHQDVVKAILDIAENYSLKNALTVPYEYFCWKTLLKDTQQTFDFMQKLDEPENPKYAKFEFNENSLDNFETWFFDENDDFFLKTLNSLLPLPKMESTVDNFLDILKKYALQFELNKKVLYRLKITAVLMSLCGNKNLLSVIAAINNKDSYNYFEEFMLKHSVYEYFLREKENINSNVIKNVFTQKNDDKPKKFNEQQIDAALNYIEGTW